MKDNLVSSICVGGGYVVPILIDELGIIEVGEGLAFVLIFTVPVGLRFLWEYLEDLIVYLMKTREEKEQLHREKWQLEVNRHLVLRAGPYWSQLLL